MSDKWLTHYKAFIRSCFRGLVPAAMTTVILVAGLLPIAAQEPPEPGALVGPPRLRFPQDIDVPDMFVSKGASGEAVGGHDFEYYVSYGNSGDATAHSVVLTDTLPSNVTYVSDDSGITPNVSAGKAVWNLGTVNADAADGFSLIVHIADTVSVGTDLVNTVEVSTSDEESDYLNNSFPHTATTVSPKPDLGISKGASGEATAGLDFSYYIGYENQGSAAANHVTITDTLPSNVTYVSDDSGVTPSVSGGKVVWNVGTVNADTAAGFNLTVHIPATVQAGTWLTNTVDISTESEETDYDNNSFFHVVTTVPPKPDMSVSKGASGEAVAGLDFSYYVAYSNEGSATAGNVIITDTLPSGVTYVLDDSGITPNVSGGKAVWNLGAVNADVATGFNLVVHIPVTVKGGTLLTNTVDISTQSEEIDYENNSFFHIATVVPPKPDLAVSKGASGEAMAGSDLSYYVAYANEGSAVASAVVITDTLPDGVTYVSDDSGFAHTISNSKVRWNLGAVNANTFSGFNLVVHVAGTVPAGTLLSNRVDISTSAEESDYNNNAFIHELTTVSPKPDLNVSKHSLGSALAGQNMRYQIACANLNMAAASNVVLTDTLPSGLTYVSDNSGHTPTVSGNRVVWNLETANANSTVAFTLVLRIADTVAVGTELVNRVNVSTSSEETDYNNNASSCVTTVVECYRIFLPLVLKG
jgi:uncharacterized repeat protein (TIGR01451 family)